MCLLALNLVSCGKEVTPEKEKKDNPQEQTDPEPDGGYTIDSLGTYAPIRILFIGNSHTLDSTDLLPLILNEAGVKNIELTRAYHGGYYLVGYNANYDSPTICSWTRWQPGQNMWRVSDLSADEIREYRGTLTEPGKEDPGMHRSVEENLQLFEDMKNGKTHVFSGDKHTFIKNGKP